MKRHEAGNCELAHTFAEPTAFPPQDEFVLPGKSVAEFTELGHGIPEH